MSLDKWVRGEAELPTPPPQLTPTIMDWDINQWAVAIKRVGIGGTRVKDMDKCRKEYLNRYGCEPLARFLIGVEAEGDYDLAAAIFEHEELIRYVDLEHEYNLERD